MTFATEQQLFVKSPPSSPPKVPTSQQHPTGDYVSIHSLGAHKPGFMASLPAWGQERSKEAVSETEMLEENKLETEVIS